MNIRDRRDQERDDPNRLKRTYNVNNLWYFELRGGGQQGPFDSEKEMKQALEELIKLHKEVN